MNDWGFYEIDFYDSSTEEERKILRDICKKDISGEVGCYYLNDKWTKRISGMSFNISSLGYYENLKNYLDFRLNQYLRKEKLKKLYP